ncbi:MAG: hypothetical protein ACHWZW_20920 [Spirulina sp.]
MKEQLEQRLQSLKAEFESGQTLLRDLEQKQSHLRETLLRISGAIQVLEEMLEPVDDQASGDDLIAPSPNGHPSPTATALTP